MTQSPQPQQGDATNVIFEDADTFKGPFYQSYSYEELVRICGRG